MSKELYYDDLKIGMFITILQGRISKTPYPTPNGVDFNIKEDRYFNGKVLRVIAMDIPYVVVEFYSVNKYIKNKEFDTRVVKFGSLSTEYIKTLHPQFETKEVEKTEKEWIFEQEEEKKK